MPQLTGEEYQALKESFIDRITENRTCKDVSRLKKNYRKLVDELNEKAERRLAGLKDFDAYADKKTKERILAKIDLEKSALDDALDEILTGGKLSLDREIFTGVTKAVGARRKHGSFLYKVIRESLLFLFCVYIGLPVFGFLWWGAFALMGGISGYFVDARKFVSAKQNLSYALYSLSRLNWVFDPAQRKDIWVFILVGVMFYVAYKKVSDGWKDNTVRESQQENN